MLIAFLVFEMEKLFCKSSQATVPEQFFVSFGDFFAFVFVPLLVPRIIDLSPLISESGHYTVISDVAGKKAAYFINVCRPLEPIHNVSCPPGAAACEITRDGKAEVCAR